MDTDKTWPSIPSLLSPICIHCGKPDAPVVMDGKKAVRAHQRCLDARPKTIAKAAPKKK